MLGVNMWNKHNCKLEVEPELKILQDHLLANCLCSLPQNSSPPIALLRRVIRSNVTGNCSVDEILMHITCIHLICEKSLKQGANTYRCRALDNLFNDLIHQQNNIIKYFLFVADDPDQYVRFAAARALVLFFLTLKTRLQRAWLDKLVNNIHLYAEPHRILFSLDVLKRLMEWKDFEEHVLEDFLHDEERPVPTCCFLSMHAQRVDSTLVKCLCIEVLSSKWTRIVGQFVLFIRSDPSAYEHSIILFLNLWEAIISIKANLSVIDTKPFYCSLDTLVPLLNNHTPSLIWKSILNLFNEVLCYGNTLALQHDLAGEPCSLAHIILRNVKDRRMLRMVPSIGGSGSFGGCSKSGDKILLKKIVLLILKAVAITVKEAKYDSSSDSSLCSEQEDEDRDMDLICRSIHDVLKKLDTFVKENDDYHPSARLASWIVHLFIDQDDYLIESMICCVDVARVLCYRNNFLPELRKDLNPSETFFTFTNATSYNADLLVDYLKSNETCFLLYILNFLKYLRDHWGEFVNTCRFELQSVKKLFSDLLRIVVREVETNRINYNISPVLRLLTDCESRFRVP